MQETQERYTLTELRAILGVSLLTLRRWLLAAGISPERDRYDAHKYRVSRSDAVRVAELHAREIIELDRNLPVTLEAAHREIVVLRKELEKFRQKSPVAIASKPVARVAETSEDTSTPVPHSYYNRLRETSQSPKPTKKSASLPRGEPLPREYVSYQSMAKRHSVPTSNVEYAVLRARETLPVVKGAWFEGAQHIYYALDAEGQAAFVARFWGKTFAGSAERPRFQECDIDLWPECPCHRYEIDLNAEVEA